MYYIAVALISFAVAVLIFLPIFLKKSRELESSKQSFRDAQDYLQEEKTNFLEAQRKITQLQKHISILSKYEGIADVDKAINEKKRKLIAGRESMLAKLKQQVHDTQKKITAVNNSLQAKQKNTDRSIKAKQNKIENDIKEAEAIIQLKYKEAKQTINEQLKEAREKRENIFMSSSDEASQIVARAEQRAEEIAGDALKAAKDERQLGQTIKAMKNTIKGYGEEYLLPAYSLLDELADEYDFKEAGQQLKNVRERIRLMIKNETAATCDYVQATRKHYAVHFVLDAFNGKVAGYFIQGSARQLWDIATADARCLHPCQ